MHVRDVDCDRARARVSCQLDGRLGELDRRALARHLARCAGCRQFAEQTAAITLALRNAPLDTFRCRPIAPPRRRRAVRAQRLVPSLAALLLVSAVVGSTLAHSPDRTQEQPEFLPSPPGFSPPTALPVPESPPAGRISLPIGQRSAGDDF